LKVRQEEEETVARRSKTCPFEEGEVVAIGLPSGGYALTVIARVSRKKQMVLVYAFAPRYPTLPSAEVLAQLEPGQAIVTAFVDLHKLEERMARVPPCSSAGAFAALETRGVAGSSVD
jgi:hypothetical protein